MSTNIFCNVYVDLKAKVKINGVTREKYRGMPIFVIQQEDTKKLKKVRRIGTIRAGVIEGETDFPGLACFSIYYTKPVHFLIMASEEIKWITKERDVYDSQNHT